MLSHAFITLSVLSLLAAPAALGAKKSTWEGGHGSADAACRAKVDETGAYQYARVEMNGDVGYCYVKPKDGEGAESHASSVTKDEPAEETQEGKGKEDDAKPESTPLPAQGGSGSGSQGKEQFPAKCVPFTLNDWSPELNAAYKAQASGTGGAEVGLKENQNAAVLEWNEAGSRKTQWFTSGDGHTEYHIMAYITSKKIPKESVTRIYTELSPCLKKCIPALSTYFKGLCNNITIEFTWYHGSKKEYQNCSNQPATQERWTLKQERLNRVKAGK